MTAIHSHLKQLRQDRGMTQETVAQRMGLTRQAVSSHEWEELQNLIDKM